MLNYDDMLDMYNDAFNYSDKIDLEEAAEESSEETVEESSEEAAEESPEEAVEESSEEAAEESIDSAESSIEVYGTVEIGNYDTFSTPLNDCSAVTISLCLIVFFVMLATIGGVLVD